MRASVKDTPVRDFTGNNRPFADHLNEMLSRVNKLTRELSSLRERVSRPAGQNIVLVKITGAPTGIGRYPAKIFLNSRGTDIPTSGNLTETQLGELPSVVDCLLVNIGELNGASHVLGVNSYHLAKADFPMQSDGKTVCFVDGCAITDLRYNETNHAVEASYTCNPGTSDWIPKIIASACPSSASAPASISGTAGGAQEESDTMTFSAPNGETVKIATANTAVTGAGTIGRVFTAGASGSKLTFLEAKAAGSTTKGKLNIFRAQADITPSTLTRVTTTATFTATGQHGLATGDYVFVRGADQLEYNGNFQVTVTSATVFTYTMSADPGASGTGTIRAGKIGWIDEFAVDGKTPVTIDETWEGTWLPKDTTNGMMLKPYQSILVATYVGETFYVTSNGADI